MATKKTATKKAASKACWEKVWVIGGDPCMVRFAVEEAIQDAKGGGVVRFSKDDAKALKDALTAWSFAAPDTLVLTSPNAEMLKACQEAVDANTLTAAGLIVVTPGDTIDARTGFGNAANKNKRVFYLESVEATNTRGLREYLSDWSKATSCKLDATATTWLVENAPTMLAKVKTATGKKDVLVFDLQKLENELAKVAAVVAAEGLSAASSSDVQQLCHFDRAIDVWQLVNAAIAGDEAKLLGYFDKVKTTSSNAGPLWLIASQLEFLVCVKHLIDTGVRQHTQIAEMLSLEPLLGRYLLENWQELEEVPSAPAVNTWRVGKAAETVAGVALERLIQQYEAVMCAVRDLRNGLPSNIVLPFLGMALAGNARYTQPLLNLY